MARQLKRFDGHAADRKTMADGDTLFALGTGQAGGDADLTLLGMLAAESVARAIRNAVRAAEGLRTPELPAARDLHRA